MNFRLSLMDGRNKQKGKSELLSKARNALQENIEIADIILHAFMRYIMNIEYR